MSNETKITGLVSGADDARVVIRANDGAIIGESSVVGGSYEMTADLTAFASEPGTLADTFPFLAEAMADDPEEHVESIDEARFVAHVLQQEPGWQALFAGDDKSNVPEATARFEVIADGEVVHAHPLRLTNELAGDHLRIDTMIEPPPQEAGYATPCREEGYATPCNALPDEFDTKSAEEKLAVLWGKCWEGRVGYRPKYESWWNLAFFRAARTLFEQRLREGLADAPAGPFLRPLDLTAPRIKVVHRVGAVAKARFVPKPSPYAGLFSQTCEGLIRCSSSLYTKRYFIPGIALKFPISGQHSRNLVALVTLQGQGNNRNFFWGDMVTDVPPVKPAPNTKWFFRKLLFAAQKKIEKQSIQILEKEGRGNRPGLLPLSPLSEVTQAGQRVSAPVTPTSLRMIPTNDVRSQWDDDDTKHFFHRLRGLREGTPLYEVVAKSASGEAHIGTLFATSRFILSRVADEQLHFGHLFPAAAR